MPLAKVDVRPYLRKQLLPHIWCAGCGHGIVLGAMARAMHLSGIDRDKTVIVSGIGCSSRASGYLDFDTVHTTHGRALAFATGVKVANPELNVVVLTGDGDAAAIGGNHLIHAARRNVGLTCICLNNSIYGMTGGQYSPETPECALATTAPYGKLEPTFDLCDLARAAGASYVARSTAYHVRQLEKLLVKAIQNDGFSFVEVVDQCPTYFGRKNKPADPYAMMMIQKERAVPVDRAAALTPEERREKLVIGELHKHPRPEYTRMYDQIIAKARATGGSADE